MGKRGISNLVAVVMLIMLSVILAVAAGFYIPSFGGEDVIVSQDVSIETGGGYTYFDSALGIVFVQVRIGPRGANIERLEFLFFVDGSSNSVFRDDVPDSNVARVYEFSKDEIGGIPESVKVVPVYFGRDAGIVPVVPEVELIEGGIDVSYCRNSVECDDGVSYTDDVLCYDAETGESSCSNEVVLNVTYSYMSGRYISVLSGSPISFYFNVENRTIIESTSVYYRIVGSSDWFDAEVEFEGINTIQQMISVGLDPADYPDVVILWSFSGVKFDGLDSGFYEFKFVVRDVKGNFAEHYYPYELFVLRHPVEGDCLELIEEYNSDEENKINIVFIKGIRTGTVPYTGDELREKAIFVINNSPSKYGRYGGLLHVEPFASNVDLFNFWYVAADDVNAYSACVLQNKVTVRVYNSGGRSNSGLSYYGCSADYQVGIGGSINLENRGGGVYASVFVHEIGHVVGGLYDEYIETAVNCSIGSRPSFYQFMPNVICVNKSFSESEQKAVCEENSFWSNLGLECFRGCYSGRNNCWRASSYSLMKSTYATSFYEVNERYICHILSCKGFDVGGSYCDNLCFGELGYDARIGKIGCDVGEVCQAGECVNE